MVVRARPEQCAYTSCRRRLTQTSKTRRKIYCDDLCRRRAQRERDRARSQSTPPRPTGLGTVVAGDIAAIAQELLEAEERQAPLELRLTQARLLHRDVACYVAAVVQDTRRAGAPWDVIAAAAEVTEASARARWNETKVAGLLAPRHTRAGGRPRLSRHASEPPLDWLFTRPSGQMQEAAARVLQTYLAALYEGSPVAACEVARQADLPGDAVRLALAGEFLASWPVTHMLITILGGCPQEVRGMWRLASGEPAGSRATAVAGCWLQEALRVIHGAAGSPDVESLGTAGPAPEVVAAVLDGTRMPDWRTAERIVIWLGYQPSVILPFWEAWDRARRGDAGCGEEGKA
ncbi:hypothetical protein OIE62_07820 [Streptomyces scopuliridis]|uniref:Uncharacterized protein n=1 Tax=Streptomyces scopuliridis TaxID=452529 RepID=A0ACD4ZUR9_9ACTN|nr:hypothetical protein [Streptomyces scopuliridis]WSC01528.1 hypothetical protein OG835_34000 [Streptomyces scopuliridis]WSC04934.1 hypothetical protein OIE62_07820 [Streptomyces scopuliridis]